jgi:sugar lactone lactonase YvrE
MVLGGAAVAQGKQCTVSGKVTDLATGKPVVGLRMMVLVTAAGARKVEQVVTGAGGSYSAKVARGSMVGCYFMPEGTGGAQSFLFDEEWWSTWRPASVKVAKDTVLNHKIKLVPVREIRLIITDSGGSPAVGASVMVGRTNATSGAGGKAVVRVGKNAGATDLLIVSAKRDCGAAVRIEPGKDEVRVSLSEPARISGSVIAADGKPAAGLKIQAMPSLGGQAIYQLMSALITTDERGRFELSGYPVQSYELYWDKADGFKRGQATVTFADPTTLNPATAERAIVDPAMFAGSVCRTPATKVRQASCFALDPDDNILVCDEASSRILKLSPDDKLLAAWKVAFPPQSMDVRKDGSVLVGGNGSVAILDTDGTVKVKGTVPGKRAISAVAHSGDEVFVCVAGDAGFAVYRMKDDLKTPRRIIANLSGCCGQLDIRAYGQFVYAAENTRFSIGKYDFNGKKVADYVHSDPKKDDYYGEGCCEPKNICFAPDGTIYTAASGQMEVKRYTADGKYIGAVGKLPDADGSCVRVTLGVSKDGSRVYMLDTSSNCVRLLKEAKS